jgi:hypothetical protein
METTQRLLQFLFDTAEEADQNQNPTPQPAFTDHSKAMILNDVLRARLFRLARPDTPQRIKSMIPAGVLRARLARIAVQQQRARQQAREPELEPEPLSFPDDSPPESLSSTDSDDDDGDDDAARARMAQHVRYLRELLQLQQLQAEQERVAEQHDRTFEESNRQWRQQQEESSTTTAPHNFLKVSLDNLAPQPCAEGDSERPTAAVCKICGVNSLGSLCGEFSCFFDFLL